MAQRSGTKYSLESREPPDGTMGAVGRRNGADEPAPRLARSGPWPRVVFKAALVLELEQSHRLQIDDRLRPCGSPIPPKVTDWLPTRAEAQQAGSFAPAQDPVPGPVVFSPRRSILAAMMKSFSCRPLIFLVLNETVA